MTDPDMRPRADRRHLQQIIAGLTEGVILIDPDQTIAWANETALAMHGVERLEELGATVSEYRDRFELRYRNNHRLDADQYPADRVVAGEAFSDITVAVAPAGEDEPRWVHQIRSLVLTDNDGQPDSLVLVLHDATERFDAEERFEAAFNANPAPAVIGRLSDLRYVKVNHGFLEMTGYLREQVIGRSVYELDVLENAEKRELAIERLGDWRTIPQMEATLRLPEGGSKFVIVAGQPIEIADERCMLFTFVDLEPRKRAEEALRQSEEQFAKTFRLAPAPIMVSQLETLRILDVNEAFVTATGYAAGEVVGRSWAEVGLWADPADAKPIEAELERTGSLRNREVKVRSKEGEPLDVLFSAETVAIHGQPCVLSLMQDITERKRSETELIAAIEAVMQDASWFGRTVIEKLANMRRPAGSAEAGAALADLSARERQVLTLLAQGLSDPEIAAKLGVSRNTIRNHVTSIYGKIGVGRRSAAIVWARERGLFGGTETESPAATRRRK